MSEDSLNVQAWQDALALLKKKNKTDELLDTYERALKVFPLSGELWTDYIELLLAQRMFEKAEHVFDKVLLQIPYVPLWHTYLKYIRQTNAEEDEKAVSTIAQAYEFALTRVQYDLASTVIWREYLEFLEKRPAQSTWQQQHKMDEIRKIFRWAVVSPMDNIEALWRNYTAFENSVSRATSRKFVDERSGQYMQARSVTRELSNLTKDLARSTWAGRRMFIAAEAAQLALWRKVIAYEASNPLQTDAEAVQKRVLYAYRQATATLSRFPEMWFEAAEYCIREKLIDEAIELLKSGLQANPSSLFLSVRLADLYVSLDRPDAVQVFKDLITMLEAYPAEAIPGQEITLAYIELMKLVKRTQGVKEARKVASACRKLPYATFHIYCASAMLELTNKDLELAQKIYEIAYKKFRTVPQFVRSYLKFLFQMDDAINSRVVFEKAMADMSPAVVRVIFDEFMDFVAARGDTVALQALEPRYCALYPDADPVELFARRFRQFGADPIGEELHLTAPVKGAHELMPVPASIVSLAERLPPAGDYDGPQIDMNRLVEIILEYA